MFKGLAARLRALLHSARPHRKDGRTPALPQLLRDLHDAGLQLRQALGRQKDGTIDRAELKAALDRWMNVREAAEGHCARRCSGACVLDAGGCQVERIRNLYEIPDDPR